MSRRLRVLSLSTLFPAPTRPAFGGFVARQMAAVAARGDVDLTVVNPIGLPPWPLTWREPHATLARNPAISELDGLTVHHPRFLSLPTRADHNPARIARAVLPLARRLHAEAPFDLVDAQFLFPDGPAAMRIAAALGLPFTMKARGSDVHHWGARPAALAQLREAGRHAAGMLAVSEALRRDMIGLGLSGEAIRVHYTGLDHARFRPLPRAEARAQACAALGLAIPGDAALLSCTGSLIAIKGQALAIEALEMVPHAHLVLAGRGPDEVDLRRLAARLGLADRVHFLGQVSHDVLPLLLAGSDAMVLPSEREGLANAWIEALACGTPLVIPEIGGAHEVVRDASAGRVVDRNPAAIAAAVRELLLDPPAPETVAGHAARFSWEANAAQLTDYWRELAA